MASEKRMTVKLFCPSLSKVVSYVAREDQRLDLGSIARTFGLDPWSVKLNGHFISRGRDFISSSLTWNSLLSFFSSRSLPTGAVDANPLVVDGKLCRPGTKSTWLYALFFLFYSVFGCPENGGKRNGTHLKLYFFLLFFFPFSLELGLIFSFLFLRFLSNEKLVLGVLLLYPNSEF